MESFTRFCEGRDLKDLADQFKSNLVVNNKKILGEIHYEELLSIDVGFVCWFRRKR